MCAYINLLWIRQERQKSNFMFDTDIYFEHVLVGGDVYLYTCGNSSHLDHLMTTLPLQQEQGSRLELSKVILDLSKN